MAEEIRLLDVVALTEDVPEHGLVRGQVGTVVETLSDGHFEVEFSDDSGRAYAFAALAPRQLIVLRYQPAQAA
jgi:membrane protein implicated in regulation of membrane protease activity